MTAVAPHGLRLSRGPTLDERHLKCGSTDVITQLRGHK